VNQTTIPVFRGGALSRSLFSSLTPHARISHMEEAMLAVHGGHNFFATPAFVGGSTIIGKINRAESPSKVQPATLLYRVFRNVFCRLFFSTHEWARSAICQIAEKLFSTISSDEGGAHP
jgi:hypothetical protein